MIQFPKILPPRPVIFFWKNPAISLFDGFHLFIAQKNRNFILYTVVTVLQQSFLKIRIWLLKTQFLTSCDGQSFATVNFKAKVQSPHCSWRSYEHFDLFTSTWIDLNLLQHFVQFLIEMSKRSYVVQPDGSSFRIAVRLIGRMSKQVKTVK